MNILNQYNAFYYLISLDHSDKYKAHWSSGASVGNQGKPSRRVWERSMFGSFHSPTNVVFVVLKSHERERARWHPCSKKITHNQRLSFPATVRPNTGECSVRTPLHGHPVRQARGVKMELKFWVIDVPLRTRVLVPSCGKLNSRTFSEESGTDFPQDERNARVSWFYAGRIRVLDPTDHLSPSMLCSPLRNHSSVICHARALNLRGFPRGWDDC